MGVHLIRCIPILLVSHATVYADGGSKCCEHGDEKLDDFRPSGCCDFHGFRFYGSTFGLLIFLLAVACIRTRVSA